MSNTTYFQVSKQCNMVFFSDQRTISAYQLTGETPQASDFKTVGNIFWNQRHFYANVC